MNMKVKLLLILMFLLLCSCQKENLTFPAESYNGTELKINGYYYHPIVSENITTCKMFYRNGMVLYFTLSGTDTNTLDNQIWDMYNIFSNDKTSWRSFQITNNSLKIAGWNLIMTSDIPEEVAIIENDTTFKIILRVTDNEGYSAGETYHFRQFSSKPDSTVAYQWIE